MGVSFAIYSMTCAVVTSNTNPPPGTICFSGMQSLAIRRSGGSTIFICALLGTRGGLTSIPPCNFEYTRSAISKTVGADAI